MNAEEARVRAGVAMQGRIATAILRARQTVEEQACRGYTSAIVQEYGPEELWDAITKAFESDGFKVKRYFTMLEVSWD